MFIKLGINFIILLNLFRLVVLVYPSILSNPYLLVATLLQIKAQRSIGKFKVKFHQYTGPPDSSAANAAANPTSSSTVNTISAPASIESVVTSPSTSPPSSVSSSSSCCPIAPAPCQAPVFVQAPPQPQPQLLQMDSSDDNVPEKKMRGYQQQLQQQRFLLNWDSSHAAQSSPAPSAVVPSGATRSSTSKPSTSSLRAKQPDNSIKLDEAILRRFKTVSESDMKIFMKSVKVTIYYYH